MVSGLKAHASPHRVALILSNGKTAGIRETIHRIAPKEQSANDWSLPNSYLIGVADVTGETAPARNLDSRLLADNPCLRKSDWETDSRIQQHVVIGIVAKIATEHVGIKPKLPENALREAYFVVVGSSRPHR